MDMTQTPNLPTSLSKLQTRMDSCRLCLEAGYEIYPRAIYAGSPQARMMVIGQAPGITEKEAGRPFNAGSGTRLFQWLEGAGIEEAWFRATQYMTSITKCYPGRSKSGGGDRLPSKAEQHLCQPFLETEIELINPQLIMPVGRLAIEYFFPNKPALKEIIGTQHRQNGRWIVPLPHPSGASRWHQVEANRTLIYNAVGLIKGHHMTTFDR